MMEYLVDSDRLIDYLNGKDDALELLTPLIEKHGLATSIIVYGEIYEGLLDAAATEQYISAFVDVVSGAQLLGPDERTAEIFAYHRLILRGQGQLIPDLTLYGS